MNQSHWWCVIYFLFWNPPHSLICTDFLSAPSAVWKLIQSRRHPAPKCEWTVASRTLPKCFYTTLQRLCVTMIIDEIGRDSKLLLFLCSSVFCLLDLQLSQFKYLVRMPPWGGASGMRRNAWGRPRTHCRGYISHGGLGDGGLDLSAWAPASVT